MSVETDISKDKEITKTFLSGKLSATLIIPIEIARRHGLEKPSHVIVEEKEELHQVIVVPKAWIGKEAIVTVKEKESGTKGKK